MTEHAPVPGVVGKGGTRCILRLRARGQPHATGKLIDCYLHEWHKDYPCRRVLTDESGRSFGITLKEEGSPLGPHTLVAPRDEVTIGRARLATCSSACARPQEWARPHSRRDRPNAEPVWIGPRSRWPSSAIGMSGECPPSRGPSSTFPRGRTV